MIATPTLVMFAGLPGTGKSTLALALGKSLGWPVVDKDILNAVLLEANLAQSQAGPLAYELVLRLTKTFLVEQRQSMILDTAGRQPFIFERARLIAQEAAAQLKVIHCTAPQSVRQARLAARISGPSQWTSDQTTLEEEQAWFAHLPEQRLILNSDQDIEHIVTEVLLFIQGY